MAIAAEQGVHEDEGGADDDEVDEGVEHEHDEEDDPLISVFVADEL